MDLLDNRAGTVIIQILQGQAEFSSVPLFDSDRVQRAKKRKEVFQ